MPAVPTLPAVCCAAGGLMSIHPSGGWSCILLLGSSTLFLPCSWTGKWGHRDSHWCVRACRSHLGSRGCLSPLRYSLGIGKGHTAERARHRRMRSCPCHLHLAPARPEVLSLFNFKTPSTTFLNLDCSSVILNWGTAKFRTIYAGGLEDKKLKNQFYSY